MSLSGTAIYTLDGLRAAIAKLDDLPGDTPIVVAENDGNEEDSYSWIHDIDVALWDETIRYELPGTHPDGKEQAPEDAVKAIFIW